MRGIVYKDLCLLFRILDWRGLLACGALTALFLVEGGAYAGMLLSAGLSMLVGMMNVLVFEHEEKAGWRKYQRTLPVSGGAVVAGKYAAVLLSALPCAAGAVLFNLALFAVYGRFAPLGLSVLMAVVIPLAWAVVSLPAYYWFGYPAAQYTGALPFLALCVFFRAIGDGGAGWAPALASMAGSTGVPWLLVLPVLAGGGFLSMAVSTWGYCRKN